jgi:hypothetical protein
MLLGFGGHPVHYTTVPSQKETNCDIFNAILFLFIIILHFVAFDFGNYGTCISPVEFPSKIKQIWRMNWGIELKVVALLRLSWKLACACSFCCGIRLARRWGKNLSCLILSTQLRLSYDLALRSSQDLSFAAGFSDSVSFPGRCIVAVTSITSKYLNISCRFVCNICAQMNWYGNTASIQNNCCCHHGNHHKVHMSSYSVSLHSHYFHSSSSIPHIFDRCLGNYLKFRAMHLAHISLKTPVRRNML